MKIPVDIHTHRQPEIIGESIVNVSPETFAPQDKGWYSAGIHPWHVPAETETALDSLKKCLNHPRVVAVGEAGLDKLTNTPMSVQIELFEQQARMAEAVGKPLLIHLVKATDELLKIKKAIHPAVPWIIHGFRGKAALMEEYLEQGFYLSFGEKYQEESLRQMPIERLFIETDESPLPVEELYIRAASVRETTPDALRQAVQRNIHQLFFLR